MVRIGGKADIHRKFPSNLSDLELFPINISAVKRDHDFLDRDLVEPLCRRLNTLNKCATMKLDVSHPKKKSDDSDEDDHLAISKRWTFEWSSRRWSRLQDFLLDNTNESSPTGLGEGLRSTVSSESVLTDLSEQEITEISSLHSEDSASAMPDSISMASLSASYQPPRELPHYNSLPIKSSRHGQGGKSKAKEFLRKMELMRTWGPSTMKKSSNRRPQLVINGDEPPVSDSKTSKDQITLNVSPSKETVAPSVQEPACTKPRTASKRSSMYLEDMELPSQGKRPEGQSQFGRNQFRSYENLLIHIPKDHKPGTFPKALSIESLAPSPSDRNNNPQSHSQTSPNENGLGEPLSKPACPGAPRGSRVRLIQNLLKEAKDKSKGWVSRLSSDNTELAFKKVGDGNPLRRWRVCLEVSASPSEVLQRLLKERLLWQTELQQEKVLETLDKQTDVYHYTCCNMAPQPCYDYVVLRSWRTDLCKESCALVCVSVEHDDSPHVGAVRGVVLESQYFLEPCGMGKTRLTHISRVDLRGRSPEWYNKAFGHLCVNEAQRIRSSFLPGDQSPEAKN
uniref:START domain-containing protein n=1 Tax=Xiphophorus couchianus TaxID=32473 RepID=A0A3B5LQI6_9TELE